MGLPEFIMTFTQKARTAVRRSSRGVVACILKDSTEGAPALQTYRSLDDVDFTKYSERNYDYLKLICAGSPAKIMVAVVPPDVENLSATLKQLKNYHWNYLTVPGASEADIAELIAWIKEQRETDKKTFKVVLPNSATDYEGVINSTTDNIRSTLSNQVFTVIEYCARMAGIFAGLPLTRSATYYELEDVLSADTPDDPGSRIDKGELVIVFDGEKYKIGRGVNSLTTFTAEKPQDLSKIRIVEGMDLYRDDTKAMFEDYYVGRYPNDYDHKQLFVAAMNNYNKELSGSVLNQDYENVSSVDIDAQRKFLESLGYDTADMDDTTIAKQDTGSKVFVYSKLRYVDSMEDLTVAAEM